jgi:hypothetical protein
MLAECRGVQWRETTIKDAHEVIDRLSHADALSVLKTLADENEQLARRIAKIAREHLSDVDAQSVTLSAAKGLTRLRDASLRSA